MNKQEITDIELLKSGDISEFNQVVRAFKKPVFTTCLGFVHNHQDAEDLAQDVFIEVYRSIKKFRSESRLSTWIYRIAVNKSLNFIRKNKRNKTLVYIENLLTGKHAEEIDIQPLTEVLQADNDYINKELSKVLSKAIESLPKNQKTAFVLAKYDDLSYQQIAEVMELSLSSVESLIHRAKLNLQKKLLNFKIGNY